MPEVEDIVDFVLGSGSLRGQSVIVTAGGTREPIDAVRFIGNRSSGRMGVEIAKAARDQGAQVTLIAANLEVPAPAGVRVVTVGTVSELETAMHEEADVLVMAAAVSDFTVDSPATGKIKRSGTLELTLTATKDLVADYASSFPSTYCVGFALVDDDGDLEQSARGKLLEKRLSLVIGNSLEALGSSDTSVLLVSTSGSSRLTGSKAEVAKSMVDFISSAVSV
jgi:phosphopantothenoylcysteine decarboxylase/phosphopantothenate--cysteine ligase